MLKFPNGKHDDRVDAMAHLGQLLEALIGGKLEGAATHKKETWREKMEREMSSGYTDGCTHMAS